ncbi:DUF5606 family protein [Cesiribacter andamanensis]|uniref:Uncharacterized protein n=1 Tax=Cesiribacter andamanensis AMV16 TaxID=1279009 RepID=M7N8Q2_9BACT|nr:DUF5606 domain-containing protein [Cesiribacter andamanensis]EMR03591.1 hypothetical protein ADICEAN_01272 [Cesiribacter andamanensis AMV16]
MELREIASIAGKGGLYRIVKPTRSGVIVESIDGKNTRLVISANQRVSVLKEISIYTTTAEGTEPLENVLQAIYKEFGDDPGVDGNSSSEELRSFLQHILPTFDRERVYVSDIKKLVGWYGILLQHAPEVLQEGATATEEQAGEQATAADEKADKKETAPKAEKKPKAKAKAKDEK